MRGDRLDFSRSAATRGLAEWDAQTWRFETGVGYSLTRNVIVQGRVADATAATAAACASDALFAGAGAVLVLKLRSPCLAMRRR